MDYMKGYNSRNRRRRASRRNQVSRPKNDLLKANFYQKRSRSRNRRRRTRTKGNRMIPALIIGIAVLVLAAAIVWFLMGRKATPSMEQQNGNGKGGVVAGTAEPENTPETATEEETAEPEVTLDATATLEPDGMAKDVASVPTLAPGVIPTPEPTPRPKAVALTFDDGPRTTESRTPKILESLKKYGAHATFFVVGENVEAGAEILKREVEQGCEIANHSWNHANLSAISMKKVNRQYDKTAKLVKKLVGYDIKLLRPPYGAISNSMRKHLKHPMILWNVDTLDWKSRNPKKILKIVKKQVKDGDIILMHDIHPTTADSMDSVLKWLTENGYDVLTVSELAARKGAKMSNGRAYGGFYGE